MVFSRGGWGIVPVVGILGKKKIPTAGIMMGPRIFAKDENVKIIKWLKTNERCERINYILFVANQSRLRLLADGGVLVAMLEKYECWLLS